MKLGIMQPYFLPYIGYFQLMAAVDKFVIYDNIKYTKKGWINRNRILLNGGDAIFSLPLKKGSDSLDIAERELSIDFNRDKLLNQFKGAYNGAPYFSETYSLLRRIVDFEGRGLFDYLYHSLIEMRAYLDIKTEICTSSEVAIDNNLKGQDMVLAICDSMRADIYINAIGGLDLYNRLAFQSHGLVLKFIKTGSFEYPQFANTFVPNLSIVDILMFNSMGKIQKEIIPNYELLEGL